MNIRARNVAWLLPFFLTACFHLHKQQPQQDLLFAPPFSTVQKPPAEHPQLPESALILPEIPLAIGDSIEQDIPPPKHRKAYKPPQEADNTPPVPDEAPGVSAIGNLSSGEHSNLRSETEDSIAATERSVDGLNRSLSDQDRKTVGQIREYIRQAREALGSGDVDGAYTLAAKAKAVLTELIQ
jgi:hypothetical protein